jgi:secreted Zn-dependent insulinase-like peptidase
MDIIKPPNDTRNFKVIILENGIKCILIQDILLDKSYVITSVNIGSLANKEYYDGIAHLLEHMCFITSKKYKKTNYLSKKITEYGGDTNAFTMEEFTIYYLNVFHKYLEKILDIFIDFLYNAELKEEYIYNEIKNVDSEHQKNIYNDEWKYYNLKHIIADTKSNYNGFFTGSEKTLNKLDIKKKIMDFYKNYYIPENFSICIISNKPIDELCELATNKLNKIAPNNNKIVPNNNKINVTYNKFFYKNVRQKAFCMKSHNFINSISYLFETNNYKYHVDTKIFNILSQLINSTHDNSLIDFLLNLGYIYTLNAIYNIEGVFEIKLYLTNKGLKKLKIIDGYLRYTIYFYFQQNWSEIIKYYTKEYNFIFNNLEKQDTLDLGISLTQNLSNYSDLTKIYSNNYLITKEISNKKIINIFKKFINFNKCVQIIVKHNFNENDMLIDSNYNILDGYHRYAKHIIENKKKINLYIFDKKLMKKFIIGKRDEICNLKINDFIKLFYERFNCAKV